MSDLNALAIGLLAAGSILVLWIVSEIIMILQKSREDK